MSKLKEPGIGEEVRVMKMGYSRILARILSKNSDGTYNAETLEHNPRLIEKISRGEIMTENDFSIACIGELY